MNLGVSWDLVPAVDRPRERTSERALFSALASAEIRPDEPEMERSEPCACGGIITAAADSPPEIVVAVRIHQRTVRHAAWRRASEAR